MSEPTTPGAPGTISLELTAEPESIDHAQDELAALWAAHPDVSFADRFRFETAVVEIIGNIIEHAYLVDVALEERDDVDTENRTRVLRIEITIEPGRLAAELGDNGVPAGLDLSTITMPDDEAESGRGLAIALAALDDLSYRREGESNVWSLVCERRDD